MHDPDNIPYNISNILFCGNMALSVTVRVLATVSNYVQCLTGINSILAD